MDEKRPAPLRVGSLGCLTVAMVAGFVLGLNAGGKVLPSTLNWLFAFLFAAFFGVLAFVFTGMKLRRDRGVVTDIILAIPASTVVSLKRAIEVANPAAHLAPSQIAVLDADLTELANLARLLQKQPKAGANPALKARLEELASNWLHDEALMEWLSSIESQN